MPTATPEQGYPDEFGAAAARTRRETIYERHIYVGGQHVWSVWSRKVDQTDAEIAATVAELAAEFPKLKIRARTFNVTRQLVATQEV